MAVIRRILETALYCEDLKLTSGFYRRLLRTNVLLESERLVALDGGGATVLLLFQRGQSSNALQTAGGLVPAHDGSGPVHVAFAVDTGDLPAWEAQLAQLDITIESRVKWDGGGESLYFRDPEGRSVELATPGTWPTY